MDGLYPYPWVKFTDALRGTEDSPGVLIFSNDFYVSANDNFEMYLMFVKDIPVPLKKITWGWSGEAVPDTNSPCGWSLQNPHITPPKPEDTTDYPKWTNVADESTYSKSTNNLSQ